MRYVAGLTRQLPAHAAAFNVFSFVFDISSIYQVKSIIEDGVTIDSAIISVDWRQPSGSILSSVIYRAALVVGVIPDNMVVTALMPSWGDGVLFEWVGASRNPTNENKACVFDMIKIEPLTVITDKLSVVFLTNGNVSLSTMVVALHFTYRRAGVSRVRMANALLDGKFGVEDEDTDALLTKLLSLESV